MKKCFCNLKRIKKMLKGKITPFELSTILGYIYIYMLEYYEEKKYSIEFNIDDDLKSLIINNITFFDKKYETASIILDYSKKEDNPGYFSHNSKRIINMIKEKFAIDLLDL